MVERDALVRETANKLSKLLIARRDVKAFAKGDWYADRHPMELSDFENHLLGKKCMGTYLLDKKSRIKFAAFDIDLTGPGDYFVIRDLADVIALEDEGAYEGELDPDVRHGMWDAALHDATSEGYRWVRSSLSAVIRMIVLKVEYDLGLPGIPVITGGGAHVLVPFGEKIPASEGRAALHGVMDGIVGFRRTSDNFYSNAREDAPLDEETKRPIGETMSIEVFPKQDQLSGPDSFGNLIRLPFGWHSQAKMRTYIMNLDKDCHPWELPKASSLPALDAVMDRLGVTVSTGD